MGRRFRRMGAALVAALAATTLAVVAAAPTAGADDPYQPPGLDPAWPDCLRFNNGQASLGCLAEDVPGGVANADRYVFLHGHAHLNDGQAIENLNSTSPFGQGESIGVISVGDHTGLEVVRMSSGFSGGQGWWGAWVPVELSPDEPTPPVSAWIAPLRGYTSLYNWARHTPPTPAPFGAESDPIGIGGGGQAILVDDLVMPGPPPIAAGCEQIAYDETGATVRCSANGQPRSGGGGVADRFHWLWWHDSQEFDGDFERLLTPDGSYTVEVDGTAPDGWVTHSRMTIFASECEAPRCLEVTVTPFDEFADVEAGEQFTLPIRVANVGAVAVTDVTVEVADWYPELSVVVPAPAIASIPAGGSVDTSITLVASEGGNYSPDILVDATLPSGRPTSANAPVFFTIGGGPLRLEYDGPDQVALGLSDGELVVTNTSDAAITDVSVGAFEESGLVVEVTVPDGELRPLDPGQSTRFPVTIDGRSSGTSRVQFETFGYTPDEQVGDVETVTFTVGDAGSLTVNDGGDAADPDTGDGRCDVDAATDGDQCTLRAAVEEANARPGADAITFDLGGTPSSPTGPLPAVTDVVTIDGGGQATIRGSGGDGLVLDAAGSTITGLALTGFDRSITVLADATIEASTFTGTGNGAAVTDPRVLPDLGAGVVIQRATGTVRLAGNTFGQLAVGVATLAGDDLGPVVVAGNTFTTVTAGVATLTSAAGSVQSVEVGANTFTDTGVGVITSGVVGPTTVHDNTVTAAVGVLAVETFEGLDVVGNQLTSCVVCVLSVANDRFLVDDNTLTSTGLAVVALDSAPTSGAITGNRITGPIGILAAGQDHVDVVGNQVSGADNVVGILVGAARDLTLTGNTVDGSSAFGVLLGHVSQSVVSGNTIRHARLGLTGLGREPTPEEQAAFSTSGATADELWSRMGASTGVAFANSLTSGDDIGPASFYRASNFFERVDITGNQLVDNDLGLLLGGGPRGVLVTDNTIRGNDLGGIILGAAPGENGPQSVEIRRNSMSGNGTQTPDGLFVPVPGLLLFAASGLTYDYANARPHPNDTLDADVGPNGMQNFPILGRVTSSSTGTLVSGVVDSAPNSRYVVDIYASSACHASNHGEGETWLTSVEVATDGAGHARFDDIAVPRQGLNIALTATASAMDTPVRMSTSEFSPCAFPGLGTTTSAATAVGTRTLPVASNDGFAVGDAVVIGAGTASEERGRIVGFGSLILDRPLQFAHPAGTIVAVLPPGTDLAPVCVDATFTVQAAQALDTQLSCLDEGAVTYALTGTVPAGATLTPAGALRFVPPTGSSGPVTVTYTARDTAGQDAVPARVTITVVAAPPPPPPSGLTLTVTTAQFQTGSRVPNAFLVGGRVQVAPGGQVRCGDSVTLELEGGLWRQTIPGSAFRSILGVCAFVGGGNGLVGFVWSPASGSWLATGLLARNALNGVTNPVAVGLTIGNDQGATSTRATIR